MKPSHPVLSVTALALFVGLLFLSTTSNATSSLDPASLSKLLESPQQKNSKKTAAIILFLNFMNSKHEKLDTKTTALIKNSILEILFRSKLSNETQGNISKILGIFPLNLTKAEMERCEKKMDTSTLDAWNAKTLFDILYANFWYTPKKRMSLIKRLGSIKTTESNMEHTLTLTALAYGTLPYPDVPPRERDALLKLPIQERQRSALPRKSTFPLDIAKESWICVKIWTSSEKALLKIARKDPQLLANAWGNARPDLSDDKTRDEFRQRFHFILATFRKNLKQRKTAISLIGALQGNAPTIALFRDEIPFLQTLLKSPDKEISEKAKNIFNALSCGNIKDASMLAKDKTSLDKKLFAMLLSGDGQAAHAPSTPYSPYSLLLSMAEIYDNISFPAEYRLPLDKIRKASFDKTDMKCMMVLLIQRNPSYEKEIKRFAIECLEKMDGLIRHDNNFLSFFYIGIQHHWINDRDILNLVMKRLSSDTTSTKERVRIGYALTFLKNAPKRKKAAKSLLETIGKIQTTTNKYFSEWREILSLLTGQDHGADLDAWKKAVEAMPEDGEKE